MYTYMHSFSSFPPAFMPGFFSPIFPLIVLLFIWTIAIKGYALWHAARDNRRGWFIALLILNTFGLLELFYLFVIRSPKNKPPLPPAPHEEPKH